MICDHFSDTERHSHRTRSTKFECSTLYGIESFAHFVQFTSYIYNK